MDIFTIGYTQKSAQEFFETIKRIGICHLVDVRLKNQSQLAGFAKKNDLQYFLKTICNVVYLHEPILSPTEELLNGFKKKQISWEVYERRFIFLMIEREVENQIDREIFSAPTVLLCSEPKADNCHRRLVAEYLSKRWGDMRIEHL